MLSLGWVGHFTFIITVVINLISKSFIIFQVMFRKVMGDPPVGQIAFAFTTLGFLNAILMWPVCLALYLTGTETMSSDRIPWIILLIASILLLGMALVIGLTKLRMTAKWSICHYNEFLFFIFK